MRKPLQRITPFLWFDDQAEEAARFYVSIFKDSRITSVVRYDDAAAKASGRPKGSVMTVAFELDGQPFTALNGGPHFKFTEAISLVVNCETQEEVDHFWKNLSAGGQEVQCGWLKDRFGVSWQVVPTVLVEMLQDKDPEKSKRVMAAMLKMKKIEIAPLKRAYEGRASSVEFQKLTLDALRVGEEFVSDDHLVTPEDIEAHGFAATPRGQFGFDPSTNGKVDKSSTVAACSTVTGPLNAGASSFFPQPPSAIANSKATTPRKTCVLIERFIFIFPPNVKTPPLLTASPARSWRACCYL